MYKSNLKKIFIAMTLAIVTVIFVSNQPASAATGLTTKSTINAELNSGSYAEISGVTVMNSLNAKCGAGKCGSGKCGDSDKAKTKTEAAKKSGEKMKEGKCVSGKCGGTEKAKEVKKDVKTAKDAKEMKTAKKEGKCGSGKCGDKEKVKTKTEAAKKTGEKVKEAKCGSGKCGSK